jgi:hypothetical protein
MAGTPDFAVTGTDTGVPAPSQTLPPTVPQETTSIPASAQVESTPLGNATGVSNPPDEVINTSQDQGPQPQLQSQPVANTVLPPRTPLATPPSSMPAQTPPAPKGVSPDNPNAAHPAVQRAGLFHTIAEALAGGPRFAVKVNPLTGETERTRLPMSNGSILGAIALEALGGAAAGLGVKPGPGNLGRAAAAGYGQISQQQQEAHDRQNKEAADDFARHARIFETNLQMHNTAQQIGKQTLENNQAYVGQYEDLANKLINQYPTAVKDIVPESELSKYHATKDNAIPYKVVPRLDKDGHQAMDEYGSPQWDIDYVVVDPSFKADDLLTPQDREDAAKYHLQGFVDANGKPTKLPNNLLLSISMVSNYKAQIAALKLADSDLQESQGLLNGPQPNADPNASIFNMYGSPEHLADFISNHEGNKPGDRNTRNNNPGNLVADTSWSGPIDDKNLPPGQLPFRIYATPEQGRQALIKQIQLEQDRNPNMTPEEFFQKYDAADAPSYAAAARQNAGAGPAANIAVQGTKAPDLSTALATNPSLKQYLREFQPYRVNTKGSLQEAIQAYGKKNPDGAAQITKLYGGDKAVQQIDQNRELALQGQKDKLSEAKTAANNAAKTAQDRAVADEQESYLKGPDNWHFDPNINNFDNPEDAAKYLQSKGVKVPERFDSLWAIAHNRQALTSNAARVWLKGSPYSTDQAWASSYINKYINPNYNEGDYDINKNERMAMHSDKPGTPGSILQNAGTATQHMQLLQNAAKQLPNFGLDDSHSLLVLNKIATELGTQTGNSASTVFKGIRDQMALEVAKVSQGGQPNEGDVRRIQDNLAQYSSPAQIKDLIGAYSHLMAGRLQTMEDNYYTKTGEHITVDGATTKVFQDYGIGTPWINTPKGHNQPLTDPGIVGQYFLAAGKLPQGTYDPKTNPNGWNLDRARQLMARDGWVLNKTQQQTGPNQVAQTSGAGSGQ